MNRKWFGKKLWNILWRYYKSFLEEVEGNEISGRVARPRATIRRRFPQISKKKRKPINWNFGSLWLIHSALLFQSLSLSSSLNMNVNEIRNISQQWRQIVNTHCTSVLYHTIIGKTARFEPQPSLQDSARFVIRFSLLLISWRYSFTDQGCQPYVQPPTWRTSSLHFFPQWQGGPVIPPGTVRTRRATVASLTRLYRETTVLQSDSDIVTHMCGTVDDVLDSVLDLLTTYTHHSELQLITGPSLISIAHWKPFSVCSVFTSHFVTTEILELQRSSSLWMAAPFQVTLFFRLPYITDMMDPIVILITPRHSPRRQHRLFSYAYPLPLEHVNRAVP
jgi:hypothetical protein